MDFVERVLRSASDHVPQSLPVSPKAKISAARVVIKKRPSKEKWQAVAIVSEDYDEHRRLMKAYDRGNVSRDTVLRKFLLVCQLSNMNRTATFSPWVGQLRRAGLKPGSVHTYAKYVFYNMPRAERSTDCWRTFQAVRRAHADAETAHAVDASDGKLRSVLTRLRRHPIMQAALWLIASSPLRAADLTSLRRKAIEIGTARTCRWVDPFDVKPQLCLIIRPSLMKNLKTVVGRKTYYIPLCSAALGDVPRGLWRLLKCRPQQRLFRRGLTYRLNRLLQQVAKASRLTTYSFRRRYLRKTKVLPDHLRTRVSGHRSNAVTEAHYDERSRLVKPANARRAKAALLRKPTKSVKSVQPKKSPKPKQSVKKVAKKKSVRK